MLGGAPAVTPVCLTKEHDLDKFEIVTMMKVFGELMKLMICFFSELVMRIWLLSTSIPM